jgi:guanylate kinase
MQHPPIIVISGAVGSGKGTLIHALVNELPLTWVPTHTTRTVRRDDTLLSRRIFDTDATFQRLIDRHAFLEYTQIGDHSYGLVKDDLDMVIKAGKAAIMELSVDGGVAVQKTYPNALLIFLNAQESSRRERISHRHMPAEEMRLRLAESAAETKKAHDTYDYLVDNPEGSPHEAIEAVKELILEHFPKLTA